MKVVSENISSGVEAKSLFSCDLLQFPKKHYDLIIITSSWDPRCLNILNYNVVSADNVVLILFDDKDELGNRERHDKKLIKWAEKSLGGAHIINGLSTDVKTVFFKLYECLVTLCVDLGRPINILYDLSVCPRFISLSLLSRGFSHGLIKDIDYLYGECTYPERNDGVIGIEEVIFTGGEWSTLPIDFMNGSYDPSSKELFTVSVGFEGNKTLRLINREDPDCVRLVVPDPGYDVTYASRVIEANSELIKHEDITEKDMIRVNAGDAVDVWLQLDAAISVYNLSEYNQTCLCAGSKPHSLGLALSALANPKISLLYSQPQQHKYIEIIPLEKYWMYNIRSITAPS